MHPTDESTSSSLWAGLKDGARERLETRDYRTNDALKRLAETGMPGGEAAATRESLAEAWIPGVELFLRTVYQQKGRGYFAELVRPGEGILGTIGLQPRQWASALMHRDSAKGFHIHPPHVPDGVPAEDWFRRLFVENPDDFPSRPYDREQWDVMFILTGLCEMILVDERAGLPRRVMRLLIAGDSRPGPDNVAVVIPPGVAHALRAIGNEDIIMVYGTSTTFNPAWEGRIASGVETAGLPPEWDHYLAGSAARS